MRFPPPSVTASWPTPNPTNPVTRNDALVAIELILLSLALICLSLRLFVRIRIVRRGGWDDWLMVGAAIFNLGVTVSVILAAERYGWRIHVWDLTMDQMVGGRQVSIAAQTLFLFASGLAKTSILVSYMRIAPMGSWFRRLTWISIALVVAAMFIFLIVLWTQCRPAASYWNLLANARDCVEEWPPLMGQTTVTVLTDFIVYILPMPTFYNLKLPMGQRIALMVLFSFGLVVVVAGCIRMYWVHHVVEETYDVTWEGYDLWIWTAVEVNLGVICGCVPVLKALVNPSSKNSNSRANNCVTSLFSKKSGLHELRSNERPTPESQPSSSHSRHKDIDLERYVPRDGRVRRETGHSEQEIQEEDKKCQLDVVGSNLEQ